MLQIGTILRISNLRETIFLSKKCICTLLSKLWPHFSSYFLNTQRCTLKNKNRYTYFSFSSVLICSVSTFSNACCWPSTLEWPLVLAAGLLLPVVVNGVVPPSNIVNGCTRLSFSLCKEERQWFEFLLLCFLLAFLSGFLFTAGGAVLARLGAPFTPAALLLFVPPIVLRSSTNH